MFKYKRVGIEVTDKQFIRIYYDGRFLIGLEVQGLVDIYTAIQLFIEHSKSPNQKEYAGSEDTAHATGPSRDTAQEATREGEESSVEKAKSAQ